MKGIIVQELQVPNPEFIEAVKQGYSTWGMKETIFNFTPLPDGSMLIPRGYRKRLISLAEDFNEELIVKDHRTYFPPRVDIDSSQINLRPHQWSALSAVSSGETEGVICAPAGSGKTVIGLAITAMLGQPTLWITHTNPLAKQVIERINKFLPSLQDDDIGMLGSGKWKMGNIFTVGMVQTLVRRKDLHKIMNNFGLVIVDECLPAETKISMLDGTLKDVSEVKNGDITTFGEVSNKFSRISDSLIVFRGSWGEIKGTPTHRLPFIPKQKLLLNKHINTFRKLKSSDVEISEMSKINKKDFLLIEDSVCHTEKYEIGKEKARMLAIVACDGHIEKHLYCVQIGVKKDKKWFLKEMQTNCTFVDDNDIRISNCARGDLIIRNYSKKLISFLHNYIESGKKVNLLIPDLLEYASYEDIKNYIQVVFDTEGGLNKNQITITMSMPKFLYGIQHLLKKFGIVSRVVPIKAKKGYARLAISGYDAFLFYQKIGFSMERKQSTLLEIVKKCTKFVRRVEYNGIVYRCARVLKKRTVRGKVETFDFTTSKHFFVANGVLSSNCHHTPSSTFRKVVSQLNPYYLFGLTATPNRRDKLEKLMFQVIGDIFSKISMKKVEKHGGVMMPKILYRTLDSKVIESNQIQTILKNNIINNEDRNLVIVQDIVREAMLGNYCIVVSDRKVHCEKLVELISAAWAKTGIATGDYNKKYVEEQVKRFEDGEITVLVTTFALLGEGFDIAFLNRAFVAMPFRAENKVVQLIGRIQRTAEGKKDAVVYDYVDHNIGVLRNQFYAGEGKPCRYNAYAKLGLKIEPL